MEHRGGRTLVLAVIILLGIITIGIVGYIQIEGFSFTEAAYMTVITIGTVGFKEVRPLSTEGMWFTITLIIKHRLFCLRCVVPGKILLRTDNATLLK